MRDLVAHEEVSAAVKRDSLARFMITPRQDRGDPERLTGLLRRSSFRRSRLGQWSALVLACTTPDRIGESNTRHGFQHRFSPPVP